MRKNTQESKLNALLGITAKVEEVKTRSTGRVVGVSEDEIQAFREAQGLIYFLQAPALFTPKICPECEERFLVSRQYVSYCSYQCIRNSLAKLGIKWSKGGDLEALAQDPHVYEGNEPLWIRESLLKKLEEMASLTPPISTLSESDEESEISSTPPPVTVSPPDTTGSSDSTEISSESPSISGTTPSQTSLGVRTSKRSGGKRRIILSSE